jgi:hypothetical protein
MKIGDLVKYKYLKNDLGLIVEQSTETVPNGDIVTVYRVMWYGPTASWYSVQQWDWMRESGLEVINGKTNTTVS